MYRFVIHKDKENTPAPGASSKSTENDKRVRKETRNSTNSKALHDRQVNIQPLDNVKHHDGQINKENGQIYHALLKQEIKEILKVEKLDTHPTNENINAKGSPLSLLSNVFVPNFINPFYFFTVFKNEHSPIQPNRLTSASAVITHKPKIHRNAKLETRAVRRSYGQAIYVGDIYNEEYIEVMVRIVSAKEMETVLPANFLEKYNPDRKIRSLVVNWMLGTQGNIRLTDEEFYLSVNLLDQILARILVPINMYQLLATCTMWISRKLIGSDNLTASSLIDLCGNSYSIRQLLKLEQKVLKLLNFEIHSIEPYIFVNYHLRKLEIDQFQVARSSVSYILDCVSLLPEFSSARLSVLAAATVNVAIKIYCRDLEEQSNAYFNCNLSVDDIDKRQSLESMMFSQVLNMSNESYMFREPFYKYSFLSNHVSSS
ncbi:hypothetical protein JTB14_012084 [Gonioctena quinquepunctata]|nr:hypothetical protein JTB14_012084 [Gonioctena quinquepunctata]